ncbi:SDR family NAD(P)-dependent oxidoreductase [Nonomuraea sp. NPDC050451]|uniref:SDR family NAD(P)-dependent oxidoreductase n=1 Tax=Nonomuraea sp. NPDC050451 TaxID=3364364 RepID=UPI00378DA41C
MPAIAVVGAGPGLGLSIGRVFGRQGFDVALISRSRENLDRLVAVLAEEGITAAGFPADTADPARLSAALAEAAQRFGGIDVLEYSPYDGLVTVAPEQVTVDALRPEIEHILYGAITATQAVLPAMLDAKSGTLLYTLGIGSVSPLPFLATVNTAQAALRNWVHNLNGTLSDQGVHAADVAIGVMIGAEAPEGVPHRSSDDLAQIYWDLHTRRDLPEVVVTA